ncbi:hypothetical protein BFJ68_g2555 [Fusarium oxysporum]|uniref:Uncharacterized protein n=1 Tax=Fusarium oxysporum TaxID=5507 RepID=A0A420RWD4_FUSOX|nr:hypothetical protein BFJ71_g9394 [Fusarium oxysporum]RKL21287.1 hypothetical protein BFJ68_g2555 [Fusarium oxysporum]
MPVTLADNSREGPTISPLPALIATEEVKQKDDVLVHTLVYEANSLEDHLKPDRPADNP